MRGIAAHAAPLSDPAGTHFRMLPRGFALPLTFIARRGLRYGACQLCKRASGAVEPVRPPAMVSDRHDLQYY